MTEIPSALDIAEHFTEAIARRDITALASLLADDVAVWHNTDGRTQDKDEAIAAIDEFLSAVEECHYSSVRRITTATGLVQQHDLCVRFRPEDRPITVPACVILEIAGGKVHRLDEYLDPSALASQSGHLLRGRTPCSSE